MLRCSPFFKLHKKASSDPHAPSTDCLDPVPNLTPSVEKDFSPLLWQTSIQELSTHEIRFPIPQPAPSTYGVVAPWGFQFATVPIWKDLLRR